MIERYRAYECCPDGGLHGRIRITTNIRKITQDNIADIVTKAYALHAKNCRDITYLYDVYTGKQDIRHKKKLVREDINNKITVNIANQIVTFKTAYLLIEPMTYVADGNDSSVSEMVNKLNQYMQIENKKILDKECVDWMHICGVAPRAVFPSQKGERVPFHIYALDPREAFVIYHSGYTKEPLVNVICQTDENGELEFVVYTKEFSCVVKDNKVVAGSYEKNPIGKLVVIEYTANMARMGSFEAVIEPLNAINVLESNRVDSVQDFVNAFDVFQNCEIDKDTYASLTSGGQAICVKSSVPGVESKVYRIASELSQQGVQQAIDDFEQRVLSIVGMPNRNGGSSTSDTGTATIYRDGWADADSRATDTGNMFLKAEHEFLDVVLEICRNTKDCDIDLAVEQISPIFTRKNLTDIQSKAQVLCELLNNNKVHPKLAYIVSNLFPDPEEAYKMGMEYEKSKNEELERTLKDELNVRINGQSNRAVEQQGNTEIREGEE